MQDPGTIYDDSGVETFDLPGEPDLYRWRTGSGETVSLLSLRVHMFCQVLRNLEVELEDSQFVDVSSEPRDKGSSSALP